MSTDILAELGRKLDERAPALAVADAYFAGRQPLTYLAPAARTALGNRLQQVSVNIPRLVVGSLVERLRITGFIRDGAPDPGLWRVWLRNDLDQLSGTAHRESLAVGACFVLVWAGRDGAPQVSVESAQQCAVKRDPATRQVVAGLKRWTAQNRAHAIVYESDRVTRYVSQAFVPEGGSLPPTVTGWTTSEVLGNPLGQVPLVPLCNAERLLDADGSPESPTSSR